MNEFRHGLEARATDMTRDELEFSISQYLDGTLAAAERDALETRLASDAEARAVFAEYQSLQSALAAAPLPDVDWDRLRQEISAAVAREEMPAQSYKISQWLRPVRLALAASVLVVAAAIGFSLLRNRAGQTPIAEKPISIVKVDASASESGAASTEPLRIAVGPAAGERDEPIVLRYADSVVQRPSKALIVSAAPAGQDTPQTPF
jgi:anti-sigma-K factor RskA